MAGPGVDQHARRVSLSTMWAVARFAHMGDFVRAAKGMGFSDVELNHQVTPPLLAQLVSQYNRGEVTVSSVHDPCPSPPKGLAGSPQLSSLDESERCTAVDLAKRTLALAADVGAKAVIIHAGRVEVDRRLERRLRDLWPQREGKADEYAESLSRLRLERQQRAAPHLDAALRSLKEIEVTARGLGLRIGLENRYHYYEIPWVDEVAWLLDRLDSRVVGYWHDTGHAQVLANQGFAPQEDWLIRYGARMVGVHLHDVDGLQDHLATRGWDVDFAAIRPYIPEEAIRVCEFAPFNEPRQVGAGFIYLRDLGYF